MSATKCLGRGRSLSLGNSSLEYMVNYKGPGPWRRAQTNPFAVKLVGVQSQKLHFFPELETNTGVVANQRGKFPEEFASCPQLLIQTDPVLTCVLLALYTEIPGARATDLYFWGGFNLMSSIQNTFPLESRKRLPLIIYSDITKYHRLNII